jgi:hypothetical protein
VEGMEGIIEEREGNIKELGKGMEIQSSKYEVT